MLFGKPWEFWIAMIGAALYLTVRDKEKAPFWIRIAKRLSVAAFAYSLSDELAPFTRSSESLAAVVIMLFGLLVLDFVSTALANKELMLSIVRSRLGGGNGDDKDKE